MAANFSLGLTPAPAAAQAERPVLTTPWVLAPPFWTYGPGGEKSGFFIELAQLIADHIDHDLVLKTYERPKEMLDGQNNGETDLIAGATVRNFFAEANVFSTPVAQTQIRLFVRKEDSKDFDLDTAQGLTVGTMEMPERTALKPFLDRNAPVTPTSTGQAVIGLLSGELDAILYPEEAIVDWTIRAKIDHLIVPASGAYNKRNRAVVLNRKHRDLLDPINDAIAALENSGALAALRTKYRMELHSPVPEVLSVGFPMVPGYGSLSEDGAPSGFAIEMMTALAARTGLTIGFEPMKLDDLIDEPALTNKDIVMFKTPTETLQRTMDFTIPVEGVQVSMLVRNADADTLTSLDDVMGRALGVLKGTTTDISARARALGRIIGYDSPDALLQGLLSQEVDALLIPKTAVQRFGQGRDPFRKVSAIEPHVYEFQRSIALRRGLGEIRERLNDEIPVYLVSEEHAELRQKYFGTPVFWTPSRVRIGFAALLALVTALVGLLFAFILSERARRREKLASAQAEASRAEAETERGAALVANSRLQAVMDAASSGIVALDRAGRIAIANPHAHALLDIDDAAFSEGESGNQSDRPFRAWFSSPDSNAPLDRSAAPFHRALGGEPMDGQMFVLHGSGKSLSKGDPQTASQPPAKPRAPKYVRLSASTLPPEVSPEIGTVIIMDDVSEQERLRREAERAGRLSAVGQLTGGVAHDFNNLLAVIMGNLELLEEDETNTQKLQFIQAGLSATKRGADLTRSLLAFSRQARLEPEVLDLNAVVLDARNWMSRALPESIIVETSLLAGVWPVSLDRTSLESALLNLILNARDAMDGKGKLTIETANLRIDEAYADSRDKELALGRYVMLAVSDTGTGISRETMDRLFEPFFTTKGPGAGSGVGLSMVQGFAKQSGGTVQVYTEVGVGTTFKLYFPVSKAALPPSAEDKPRPRNSAPGQVRILLAEDEESVRDVLVNILRGAGYTVTAVPSGDAALTTFLSEPGFDILVTDIVMPGELQGTGLAKAIRARNADLPMIFLSGYASEATVHGNGLRPEDIRLMKPVPAADLLSAVAKAVAAKGV